MKSCSSCGHTAEFGFVVACDDCFDQQASDVDNTIEIFTQQQREILEYCRPHTDQMWAAKIVSIILGCDFRDATPTLAKYFTEFEK